MSSDSKKIKYSYLEYITFLNTHNQATVTFLLIIDWVFYLDCYLFKNIYFNLKFQLFNQLFAWFLAQNYIMTAKHCMHDF